MDERLEQLIKELKQLKAEIENVKKLADEYNAEIKERVLKGEEDMLVPFLLFGTSFTKKPQITAKQLKNLLNEGAEALRLAIAARARDLIRALSANPNKNERLSFAYQIIVKRKGFNINTLEGRKAAEEYLLENVMRLYTKYATHLKALKEAKGDFLEEFIARSTFYTELGLSFETDLAPNYAIENALSEIQEEGLLKTIKRVAIIGPGLDFMSIAGYDIYPPQSIQPFAIIDSLIRLGLSNEKELAVVTLDINDHVNQHLYKAVINAHCGKNYHLWLPLNLNIPWKKGYIDYWKTVGQKIGKPVRLSTNLGLIPNLKIRVLSVPPRYVKLIMPVELNVMSPEFNVMSKIFVLDDEEKFDLIIATDVFIYYDIFEHHIALSNISWMLRRGGFLLSNNRLSEPFSCPISSIGSSITKYIELEGDENYIEDYENHIVWYCKIK